MPKTDAIATQAARHAAPAAATLDTGRRIAGKKYNEIGCGTAVGDHQPADVFSPTGADASHLRVAA